MKKSVKYILLIIIFTVVPNNFSFGQTPEFQSGVDYYTEGNYIEALDSWLDLYNSGQRSASLSYNIGNAYFKLGDIPRSILFYERAYLLSPGDENINYNLEIARGMIVDRFQEIPELFFIKWFNLISLAVNGNTWSIISLATFALCLVFLSLYIYSSIYKMKVIGFWLTIVLFIISFATISFSWQNNTLVHDSHKAIITIPQISGKSSPDSSGTNLFIIHEGSKVTLGEKVGEWYEITLSDGNKGWIPANSFNII